jgi:hypothetical protein
VHKSQKEIGSGVNKNQTIVRIKLFDLSFLFAISLNLPKNGTPKKLTGEKSMEMSFFCSAL